MPSMIDIIRSSRSVDIPRKVKKRKCNWLWTPSAIGQIKENIDGSYLGSSGIKGIGGIFKDSDEKILLQFGKRVVGFGYACEGFGCQKRHFSGGDIAMGSDSPFLV